MIVSNVSAHFLIGQGTELVTGDVNNTSANYMCVHLNTYRTVESLYCLSKQVRYANHPLVVDICESVTIYILFMFCYFHSNSQLTT